MAAPSIDNYMIGKGNVYFSDDGATWVHVGNVPRLEFQIQNEYKDHFSSMEGVKKRDVHAVVSQTATLTLDLEEWNEANVRIALQSSSTTNYIGDTSHTRKHVKLHQVQDYGPTREYIWPSVDFTPNGAVSFIGEDWAKMTLEGACNLVSGRYGAWTDILVSA